MNNNFHTAVMITLVIIFQLMINNFINPGPYIFISLVPFAISLIPRNTPINLTIFLCFVIGLTVDIFSRGVIGVNAAAATAISVLRAPIYRITINRDRQDITPIPEIRKCGFVKYLSYISIACLAYMLIYCSLESMGVRSFLFFIPQFLLSSAASIILSCCFSLTVSSRQ